MREDVISADDLARIVDAIGLGAIAGAGLVEGGETVDRQAVFLLVARSVLVSPTCLFRGAHAIRADLAR
jgi:hypothetical protein